jgi:signal transduction histidine kinase/ABC-type cobalamin/Fe3+-siderophores transport system ATPase subunit
MVSEQLSHHEFSSDPLLSIEAAHVQAHKKLILKDIVFQIYPGQSHGIMGPRGSGKTALVQLIDGKLPISKGEIIWKGSPISSLNTRKRRPLGIESVEESSTPIPNFTLMENLNFPFHQKPLWGKSYSVQDQKNAQAYLKKFLPRHSPKDLAKHLNESDALEFMLLRALYKKPKLLILDQVFSTLSTIFRERLWNLLQASCKNGMALIWTCHSLHDMAPHSDHISIMQGGALVHTNPHDQVTRQQLIRWCYNEFESENEQNSNIESSRLEHLMIFLETLLKKFPFMALTTNMKLEIEHINEAARSFFNLREPQQQNLETLMGAQNLSLYKTIQNILEPNAPQEESIYSQAFICPNGQEWFLDIKIIPLKQGEENIGFIITFLDITEQVKLRQQAMQSEELAGLGLLAAGVAHEINNPLEVLYNDISYLKYKFKEDLQLMETIDQIQEQSQHIQEIVSNLVHFSGQSQAHPEVFCIKELLESLLKLVAVQAREQSIHIIIEPVQKSIQLSAYKNEIKQVILNIVKNAFEAMPDGGELKVKWFISQDQLSLHFLDTGHGLEKPDAVFQPFYSTKKGNGKNMGLGMSIIYGIIQKHRGDIQLNNRPEGGCDAIITLPLS